MHSLLISAVAVFILTILALVVVSGLRRRRLEQRIRLEITNQGNVQSRYGLRAEDPEGALRFQFSLDGRSLPLQATLEADEASQREATRRAGSGSAQGPSQQPAQERGPAAGVVQAADGAMGAGAGFAGLLGTLGILLPGSVGAPLLRLSARMRTQQVAVSRIRYAPAQAARVKRFVPWRLRRMGSAARTRQAAHGVQVDATPWVLTPSVLPGETLGIDLRIRAAGSARSRHASGGARQGGNSQDRPFRVISRSVEQEGGAAVVEEGTVQVLGGFWAHPFWPYVLIVASALALVVLAYWLTSGGVLPWAMGGV
jgi:hypothetical protein